MKNNPYEYIRQLKMVMGLQRLYIELLDRDFNGEDIVDDLENLNVLIGETINTFDQNETDEISYKILKKLKDSIKERMDDLYLDGNCSRSFEIIIKELKNKNHALSKEITKRVKTKYK